MINKNFITSMVFTLGILIVVIAFNYISIRHYSRLDMTKEKVYSLSQKSRVVINEIKNHVDIYVYFKAEHELSLMLKNLLKEYETGSVNIKVIWIDPYRDFEIINSLGESGKNFQINSILLKTKNKYKFLKDTDMGIYDTRLEQFGIEPKLLNFNGEAAITGALMDLADDTPPLIGLINNHGEASPNNTREDGISSLVQFMKLQGYQFSFLNLSQFKELPKQINILISIRPRVDFTDSELSILYKYLNEGGNLFLALDPLISIKDKKMMEFNLNPLLKKTGIVLENTVVIDPSKQIPYSRPDNLFIDSYTDFSIVQNMTNLPTLFFQARSLNSSEEKDWIVSPLLGTSDKAWGETDYGNPAYNYDQGIDKKGPNFIGIASFNEKNRGKIIVFGDSDFLCNLQIQNNGNVKLLENCLYWLTDNTMLLDIPPKDSHSVSVNLSQKQLIYIFVWAVIFPPLFIVLAGIVVWFKRK